MSDDERKELIRVRDELTEAGFAVARLGLDLPGTLSQLHQGLGSACIAIEAAIEDCDDLLSRNYRGCP